MVADGLAQARAAAANPGAGELDSGFDRARGARLVLEQVGILVLTLRQQVTRATGAGSFPDRVRGVLPAGAGERIGKEIVGRGTSMVASRVV